MSDETYRIAERKIQEALASGAKDLSLGNMGLTELPESLREVTQLRFLTLEENHLTTLPEWIGDFGELQLLELTNNEIAALPKSFIRLKQLSALHLRGCRLSSLPDGFEDLEQLWTLDLGNNELGHFPEVLRKLKNLTTLYIFGNGLKAVPEWINELESLRGLSIEANELTELPQSLGQLKNLHSLRLGDLVDGGNPFRVLPPCIRSLTALDDLEASRCAIEKLPDWIDELVALKSLKLNENLLTDLPESLKRLPLEVLNLDGNPLNPELAAAYKGGVTAVKQYLSALAEEGVKLNEAKLILVGEGEVGKSCLLAALRGDPWIEGRKTTHGIEIKPVVVSNSKTGKPMTLNGWDFGGQKVYRPTHQLFFSAPALYLVVWKPREGPQQGAVEYWINTIKHRTAKDAKVLVVATHGGPQQRLSDIGQQDLRDKFGTDTILGFFHVDSKPSKDAQIGIAELKKAIGDVTTTLPNVGREVPASWSRVLLEIRNRSEYEPYITYAQFLDLCKQQKVSPELAATYATILNELGYVIHYGRDDALREIVILKPDWLAKAISFVLDDKTTREKHGLVEHQHLSELWSNPPYENEEGYAQVLHPLFLRLMEQFDLSYKVVTDPFGGSPSSASLIAQLVPDTPPALPEWGVEPKKGDEQRVQICRIMEVDQDQSANAEGLFFRLIVRLQRYSLGRNNFRESVHWQRGLLLDDGYNGRALLEHVGNDVRISVRAAYPEFFLYELTKEVKWLVENPTEGWPGLRCDVMVPCIEPCGLNTPGRGLFEVGKLKDSKQQGMPKFPCGVTGCKQWQDIDALLLNAPTSRPAPESPSHEEIRGLRQGLATIFRRELMAKDRKDLLRFRSLKSDHRRMMSQADEHFEALMQTLTDEAKNGPRLFSFEPVVPGFFDRPKWISEKFRLTLWCEHSRLPLPELNGPDDKHGVYEIDLPREWVVKAAPFLKALTSTLSLVLPIAASATELILDDEAFKRIEKQLDFGQKCAESVVKAGEEIEGWTSSTEGFKLDDSEAVRAQGATLRQLHAYLREKDPGFGGLVSVQNKRREFLWVHPRFVGEYF